MVNAWIQHVKEYAKKNGMKYPVAVGDPGCKAAYNKGTKKKNKGGGDGDVLAEEEEEEEEAKKAEAAKAEAAKAEEEAAKAVTPVDTVTPLEVAKGGKRRSRKAKGSRRQNKKSQKRRRRK